MIANVQCLLPARLHKTRHAQLVWRHDNILPAKRIRPECVSFLTNTVTIQIHPHLWLVKTVPKPTESTEQVPLTPTPSAAVEIKNTANSNDRAIDDNNEIWATEADHRTGWNKTFKSGTYRGMLHGIVLGDYPKQVVSLTKARSVPTSTREFLSWAQTHYRIDETASIVERKTGAGTC